MANIRTTLIEKPELLTRLQPTPAYRLGCIHASMALDAPIQFDYGGKRRVVEVHATGLSTRDNVPVIRGWQIDGESSRSLPCWALFRLDGMTKLGLVEGVRSEAPRPGYAMGDKQMDEILCEIELG